MKISGTVLALCAAWLCACTLSLAGKNACESDADCIGGYVCASGICERGGKPDSRTSAEMPLLPVLPDAERVEECGDCVREQCAPARAACLDDTACVEQLSCRGACSDPACLQACVARHGYSAWFEDYWACAMTDACAGPCGSGENFACVGHYDAPRTEQAHFNLYLHFKNPRTGLAYAFPGDQRDEQFVLGARARSCLSPAEGCVASQLIDEGVVDAMDAVQLAAVVDPFSRSYDGMIEVEHDSPPDSDGLFHQLGWRDRYLLPFLTGDTEFRMYVYWRGWIRDAVREHQGSDVDFSTAAPLAVYLEDCSGAPARGVRIEVPSVSGVLQQTAMGDFGLDATETGSALVGDVPYDGAPSALPSPAIAVRAVSSDDGRVLAERRAFVRSGWTTHVWLMPSPR